MVKQNLYLISYEGSSEMRVYFRKFRFTERMGFESFQKNRNQKKLSFTLEIFIRI